MIFKITYIRLVFQKKSVKERDLRVVNFALNGVKWILRVYLYIWGGWAKDRSRSVGAGQSAAYMRRVDGPQLPWGRYAIDSLALR
jgi:hypothetical protein